MKFYLVSKTYNNILYIKTFDSGRPTSSRSNWIINLQFVVDHEEYPTTTIIEIFL